jgi:uncharacterized membrane protein YfcA
MDVLTVIVLLIFGTVVGAIGTLIGAGGGFFVVPLLILCYNFSPQEAVGTSLVVVFLNVLSGTFAYVKQNKIDYDTGLKFAVAASPGVLIGTHLAKSFSPAFFKVAFSMILMLMSYYLLSNRTVEVSMANNQGQVTKRKIVDSSGDTHAYSINMEVGLAGSLFIGFLASMFGLGGGIIHVPFMVLLLGIPTHIATATSHFMLTIVVFLALLNFFLLGSVNSDFAVIIGIGSIIGAYIGANFAAQTDEAVIRKIVGLTICVISVEMLLSLFG